ncbi:MAG: hypothetical protein JKY09_00260, partial [Crocinitomicaceae bacterium]|nr:hypothetical protein [Crocinitomicaceae bacterium]
MAKRNSISSLNKKEKIPQLSPKELLQEKNEQLERTKKELLEMMKDLNEEKRQVEERTIELEKANKDLREFAYIAAHDIKAPLINLAVLADMINSESIIGESNKTIYGKLKKSIQRLHKTVFSLNDIIAFKRTLND